MQHAKKAEILEGGLKCHDFIPKCTRSDSIILWPKFDKFSTILQPANEFLRRNPLLSVKSCETVHFRVDKNYVADSSEFDQMRDQLKPFVKGLRLWVTPRSCNSFATSTCDPDQIGYVTFVPQTDIEATNTLSDLTTKVNEYLQNNPLPGRLIDVESQNRCCQRYR
jgi:hypothetical protein